MTMQTMEQAASGADPRAQLAAMFGGGISVSGGPEDTPAVAALRRYQEAADAVKVQCGVPAFQGLYSEAVDREGAPAPGRMIQGFHTLTMMGSGILSWKGPKGQAVTEVIGVPVRIQPYRVYWGRTTTTGKNAPSCASVDTVRGEGQPGGWCEECPKGVWQEGVGGQRCSKKMRIYLAQGGASRRMTVVELTAMPAQGVAGLFRWARQQGYSTAQLLVKFWLEENPRQMEGARYPQAILKWEILGLADDGSAEYREAIKTAQGGLQVVEKAWQADIADSYAGVSVMSTDQEQASVPPPLPRNAIRGAEPANLTTAGAVLCPENGMVCENSETACRDRCAKEAAPKVVELVPDRDEPMPEVVGSLGDDIAGDFDALDF